MSESETKKRQYSAPALSKGLDILELMASQSEGLSLRQISDLLGRQKSELFRMLVVLEERGYISTIPDSDKYIISMKLFGLAHQLPDIKRITAIAEPLMREFSNRSEQSCHLVVERSSEGVVIMQKDSPSDQRFGIRIGAKVPLQNTCSGHVLLAFADEDSRTVMMDGIPASKHLPENVLTEICDRVKAQGFENVESQQIAGVKDIGFPIFNYSGNVIAALVVPYLSHLDNTNAMDFESVKVLLGEIAARMSEQLGYDAK
ncbi:IclR family transcriptional regulator [Parashewanella tropica]|uniref:IclR family transcriptional regulator n=1 Tax=Parashewanella tropica TaxID=2547970 RepID=UPI00105A5B69|nr:IclR family transcriptional regulator [Parashewanella tropica]